VAVELLTLAPLLCRCQYLNTMIELCIVLDIPLIHLQKHSHQYHVSNSARDGTIFPSVSKFSGGSDPVNNFGRSRTEANLRFGFVVGILLEWWYQWWLLSILYPISDYYGLHVMLDFYHSSTYPIINLTSQYGVNTKTLRYGLLRFSYYNPLATVGPIFSNYIVDP